MVLLCFLSSQEIPNDFYELDLFDHKIDAGENWVINTTLGQKRYLNQENYKEVLKLNPDSLYIVSRAGLEKLNKNNIVSFFSHFRYKIFLYGYLYSRIVNHPEQVPRYSGIPRNISRGGFNSGETDLSGIGFENKWLSLQIGRGREIWGSGKDIQISLSKTSPSYDYLMLGSNYGKIRVKYIYGFLESTSEKVNRYITARGIEWSNKKNFLLSLSEIVIFSGLDRPIDLAYLNPISTHLEIELNNRLNIVGTDASNAIWQISFDWLPKDRLRISGNYLYDEFVLDEIEKKGGKEHGKAFSGKIIYTLYKKSDIIIKSGLSYIEVGTPTFRHGNGMNNFTTRGKPIGWEYGSDSKEYKFGLDFINIKKIIYSINFIMREIGEESIINRPYDPYKDYIKGNFPSGSVLAEISFNSELDFFIKDNLYLKLNYKLSSINNDFTRKYELGFEYFLSKNMKI